MFLPQLSFPPLAPRDPNYLLVSFTRLGAFAFLFVITAALLAPPSLSAQTLKTLHTFNGPDGSLPTQGLIQDSAFNLYGATAYGGDLSCNHFAPPHGCGTIFKLSRGGSETVLYSFTGTPDGQNPNKPTPAAGNLYGATSQGGTASLGTVFELTTAGQKLGSYSFQGGTDLATPFAGPTYAQGAVFGSTYYGGLYNLGGVYKVSFDSQGNGTETTLHTFAGAPNDGANPDSQLVLQSGEFYGTTEYGGTGSCSNGFFAPGCGILYKVNSNGFNVIYNFTGGADGSFPTYLIPDGNGGFYGVTTGNFGTVFQATASGAVTTLYTFQGGNDGISPGGLVRDSQGNLFGTTYVGGPNNAGIIFELSPNGSGGWTETVLYSFTGGKDGTNPQPGIVLHENTRQIYGTTLEGGNTSGCFPPYGCGTAFVLSY